MPEGNPNKNYTVSTISTIATIATIAIIITFIKRF